MTGQVKDVDGEVFGYRLDELGRNRRNFLPSRVILKSGSLRPAGVVEESIAPIDGKLSEAGDDPLKDHHSDGWSNR